MPFHLVSLFDVETGVLMGFTIRSSESADRLQTPVYWARDERHLVEERIADLDDQERLRPFWPGKYDGEVQELMGRPEWAPELPIISEDPNVQYERYQKAAREVAEARAHENR